MISVAKLDSYYLNLDLFRHQFFHLDPRYFLNMYCFHQIIDATIDDMVQEDFLSSNKDELMLGQRLLFPNSKKR